MIWKKVRSLKFLGKCQANVLQLEKINIVSNLRMMSTTSNVNPILYDVINNKGILTANRPKRRNSINKMFSHNFFIKLLEWENKVEMVIVKGNDKAFCSGGDIAVMTSHGLQNGHKNKEWVKDHYSLIGFIEQYPLPYVAVMDGLTLGAGLSLGINRVRIATERTVVATPETKVGFFLDNALCHLLSRLPHQLGLYLGLTGTNLNGTDTVKAGITTNFIKSENVSTVLKGLIDLKNPKENLDEFLSRHSEDLTNVKFSLEPHLDLINEAFSAPTVEEIIERLRIDNSDFATHTVRLLTMMSPTSLKISKKLMELYKNMTVQEGLVYDTRIAFSFLEGKSTPDFYEGTRAWITEKDNNPMWSPSKLEDVTDEMINRAFDELPFEEDINITNTINELRSRL